MLRLGLVSFLLHGAILLLVVLFTHAKPPLATEGGGGKISLVFGPPDSAGSNSAGGDIASQHGPASGEPQPNAAAGPAAATPTAPPDRQATPAQSPATAAETQPEQAQVNVTPELSLPPAPPLPDMPPVPVAPTPTARPSPSGAPHRRSASPFAHAMNFSFGRAAPPPPGRSGQRGVDMGFAVPAPSHGSEPPGGRSSGGLDIQRLSGPDPGRDWFGQLRRWWTDHRYYPPQAIANGEDGMVALKLTVDTLGHVRTVEVVTRSGSTFLDAGALSVFRNAKLPPFPMGIEHGTTTFQLNITYSLIRG